MTTPQVSVGLLGFGLAGRVIHAPLISATPGLSLAAVASSRPDAVREQYPHVRLLETQALLRDPSIDLVVLATPDDTHFPLARAALEAGKAVVIDKPFTTSSSDAEALIELADRQRLLLSAFHNRRWDDDFLMVRQLIDAGTLGEVVLFESRFDRYRPLVQDRWRDQDVSGRGVLWDLGPHLLDQALVLFGPPRTIGADLARQRVGTRTTDYFALRLQYDTTRVVLGASMLVSAATPRFCVQGREGSFTSFGLDGQEAALKADPAGAGRDAVQRNAQRVRWDGGALVSEELRLPSGAWLDYYARIATAVAERGPPPVTGLEALAVIRGLERAEEAHRSGRRLEWA